MSGLIFALALAQGVAVVPFEDVDVRPDWLSRPSGEEISRMYPVAAGYDELEGRATVRCLLPPSGVPEQCAAILDEPAGHGFGDAAVAMTAAFRFTPASKGGVPVTTEIKIPLAFKVPEDAFGLTVRPVWRQQPSAEQLAAAWPQSATARKGSARVSCAVRSTGALDKCQVMDSSAPGFGEAALSLASTYKAELPTFRGRPAFGARVEYVTKFAKPKA